MNPGDQDERTILGLSTSGRTHIKGIYDTDPLHAKTGLSGNAALRMEAAQHEKNRLESVAEFYCLMSALAWSGLLSGDNTASKGRTTYQFGKGDRARRTEAAHCLPAQVLINGHYPNTLLESAANVHMHGLKPLPVASKLRNLFGRTDITSVEVNDTDSSIESISGAVGIKRAFIACTDGLFTALEERRPTTRVEVLRRAEEAYESYLDAEKAATRTRLNRRLGRRITDAKERTRNDLQITLLLAFMQTQARCVRPAPLHASAFRMFWNDVARE